MFQPKIFAFNKIYNANNRRQKAAKDAKAKINKYTRCIIKK